MRILDTSIFNGLPNFRGIKITKKRVTVNFDNFRDAKYGKTRHFQFDHNCTFTQVLAKLNKEGYIDNEEYDALLNAYYNEAEAIFNR